MEINVATVVETFRNAVLNADKSMLSEILDDELSYGHSDGHVEGKDDLINKLSDGTYEFVTMEFSEQSIRVINDVAVVRVRLDGKTNDGGKPNEAHLFVLMVFHKTGNSWKMVARQAVKKK